MPRSMRRYHFPKLLCAVCRKPITGETRMVGIDLAHVFCADKLRGFAR